MGLEKRIPKDEEIEKDLERDPFAPDGVRIENSIPNKDKYNDPFNPEYSINQGEEFSEISDKDKMNDPFNPEYK